jgi:hypothetical protein
MGTENISGGSLKKKKVLTDFCTTGCEVNLQNTTSVLVLLYVAVSGNFQFLSEENSFHNTIPRFNFVDPAINNCILH